MTYLPRVLFFFLTALLLTGILFSGGSPRAAAQPTSSTGPLIYHGGPVQHHPVSYLIFWGASWKTSSGGLIPEGTIVSQYFADVGGSAFESILTQYRDSCGFINNSHTGIGKRKLRKWAISLCTLAKGSFSYSRLVVSVEERSGSFLNTGAEERITGLTSVLCSGRTSGPA